MFWAGLKPIGMCENSYNHSLQFDIAITHFDVCYSLPTKLVLITYGVCYFGLSWSQTENVLIIHKTIRCSSN